MDYRTGPTTGVNLREHGMRTVVLVACLAVSGATLANGTIPKDVQVFMHNADACEHFAGEIDVGLTGKRQQEIERSVVKHCQLAQKTLKQLTEKYKNDPGITEIIRKHANDSGISFR
jgi:Flp pilus assembly protein TadB